MRVDLQAGKPGGGMMPDDSVPGGAEDSSAHAVAPKALDLIADGGLVEFGSGRAASVFITKLGARAPEGLRVSGVPTWQASATQVREAGAPLIEQEP